MKINYYSTLISEDLLKKLYKDKKPGMQVQVFNRLMVDGLLKNDVEVTCYSSIPASKEIINKTFIRINDESFYKYTPIVNIPIIKDLIILFDTYLKTKKDLKNYKNLVCLCDILSDANT